MGLNSASVSLRWAGAALTAGRRRRRPDGDTASVRAAALDAISRKELPCDHHCFRASRAHSQRGVRQGTRPDPLREHRHTRHRRRPRHRAQPLYNLLLAPLFEWGIALYDLEPDVVAAGHKSWRSFLDDVSGFLTKAARQLAKDYVVFPLLAGPSALPCLLGNLTAN